jgi:hypothetical protein
MQGMNHDGRLIRPYAHGHSGGKEENKVRRECDPDHVRGRTGGEDMARFVDAISLAWR